MVTEASVTNFGRSAGSAVDGKKKRVNAYTKEPELLLKYRAVEVYRKAVKFRLLQCHFQNLIGHESFQKHLMV